MPKADLVPVMPLMSIVSELKVSTGFVARFSGSFSMSGVCGPDIAFRMPYASPPLTEAIFMDF